MPLLWCASVLCAVPTRQHPQSHMTIRSRPAQQTHTWDQFSRDKYIMVILQWALKSWGSEASPSATLSLKRSYKISYPPWLYISTIRCFEKLCSLIRLDKNLMFKVQLINSFLFLFWFMKFEKTVTVFKFHESQQTQHVARFINLYWDKKSTIYNWKSEINFENITL